MAEAINLERAKMDDMISAIEDSDMNMGLEEFAALLALPDEEFNVLSEMILVELNKALNNPNDKILMQQSMREAGYDTSNLAEFQEELMKEIDANLGDQIPQDRIDFLKRVMNLIINAFSEAEGIAKKIINIPIEVLDYGTTPTYAHDGDAAMDIYSPEEYTINPGETKLIKTGIKVAIPLGYALLIQPRSGQSLKTKLRVANTPGLIDSGYRDEIGIILENIESPIQDVIGNTKSGTLYGKPYVIEKGQRIAQMRLVEVPTINWVPVNDIHEIDGDREGGFGSSGK